MAMLALPQGPVDGRAVTSDPLPAAAAPGAFEDWYRSEHPRVLATMAVAAGDVDVAREVTDEAFVRALERWKRVSVMGSPGGWTQRVALNLLRRRQRRAGLERRILRREPPALIAPAPDRATEVWDAVRDLSERARLAVALRYLGGLTEREVADAMGVTEGTASATLAHARQRLAQTLGDDDPNGGSNHG